MKFKIFMEFKKENVGKGLLMSDNTSFISDDRGTAARYEWSVKRSKLQQHLYRTTLLLDWRVLACGLHLGHIIKHNKEHLKGLYNIHKMLVNNDTFGC